MADADSQDTVSNLADFMKDYEENVRIDDAIQYPIEVSKVTPKSKMVRDPIPSGTWVSIRPVTDNPEKKTYLGVYLGSLPVKGATTSYHLKTKELSFLVLDNPGIYVPDLKKIVYGYESWWGKIKTPEDLQQITDQNIQDVWYVRALQELTPKSSGPSS